MRLKGIIVLLIAAIIWGFAFAFQSIGGDETGAYTFTCLRMVLGGICLFGIVKILDFKKKSPLKPKTKHQKKRLYLMGSICGVLLAIASNLQQVALSLGAEAGRAGFITTTYILFVPLIGLIFLRKKLNWNVWVAIGLAIIGLYFLCVSGTFAISVPDLLLFVCAIAYAVHILVVDSTGDIDPVRLSMVQFFSCAVVSAILMVIFEIVPVGFSTWAKFFGSGTFWITFLYMALLSSALGYTLQIVGQRNLEPTLASLIMSLESVFSVLGGFIILGEKLTMAQLLGCLLIFGGIVLAQVKFKEKKY